MWTDLAREFWPFVWKLLTRTGAFVLVTLIITTFGEVLVCLGVPAWVPLIFAIVLTVSAVLFAAMHGYARLVLRWLQEPVGVGVILFALFALYAAPQMPDMFLGMRAHTPPGDSLHRLLARLSPTGFPIAALLLGLFAWYWTRAALFGRVGLSDAEYIHIKPKACPQSDPLTMNEVALLTEVLKPRTLIHTVLPNARETIDWSLVLAPRAALSVFGIVILAPIVTVALKISPPAAQNLIWPTVASALLLVLLYYALDTRTIWAKRLTWLNVTRIRHDSRIWQSRTLSLFFAAPFGYGVALALFVASLAAAYVTLGWPQWFDNVDAPTAALFALAFLIAPLAVLLALWRDAAQIALCLIQLVGEWADGHKYTVPKPDQSHKQQRAVNHAGLADLLGLGLLAAMPIVFTNFSPWPGIYGIRTVPGGMSVSTDKNAAPPDQRPQLEYRLRQWMSADFRMPMDRGGQKIVPVIIVAAEGGASRSAAWVLSVLRMLDETTGGKFSDHVFAISSVSGGALGAATYAEMIADDAHWWTNRGFARGMRDLATGDLLAPSIANMFLPDVIRRQVQWRFPFSQDRATVLEDTFERLWLSKLGASHAGFGLPKAQIETSFLQFQLGEQHHRVNDPARVPLLFMNGTDVGSGRRLITSPLKGMFGKPVTFAAADDLLTMLGTDGRGADIRMSTAITNAARFPFISPAGRFGKDRTLVDGGVFENYGMLTARELAEAIQATWGEVRQTCISTDKTCSVPDIVPIIVLISNDDNAVKQKQDLNWPSLQSEVPTPRLMEDSEVFCPKYPERPQPLEEPNTAASKANEEKLADAATGAWRGIEGINSLFGLIATRGAHGDGELAQVRREFCVYGGLNMAQQASGKPPPALLPPVDRFFHFDMPRPVRESGESAPMNWVLNEPACRFLFGSALAARFNDDQAKALVDTLTNLGVAIPAGSSGKCHEADCDGGEVAAN